MQQFMQQLQTVLLGFVVVLTLTISRKTLEISGNGFILAHKRAWL
jgi:hypothetical protein